jgi:hypothetical protein
MYHIGCPAARKACHLVLLGLALAAWRSEGALAVTGIFPPVGSSIGGTDVAIVGAGIMPGARVTFGGVPAMGGSVALDGRSIVTTIPPHAPGIVDVVVRNPDGATATLRAGFTYTTGPAPAFPFFLFARLADVFAGDGPR